MRSATRTASTSQRPISSSGGVTVPAAGEPAQALPQDLQQPPPPAGDDHAPGPQHHDGERGHAAECIEQDEELGHVDREPHRRDQERVAQPVVEVGEQPAGQQARVERDGWCVPAGRALNQRSMSFTVLNRCACETRRCSRYLDIRGPGSGRGRRRGLQPACAGSEAGAKSAGAAANSDSSLLVLTWAPACAKSSRPTPDAGQVTWGRWGAASSCTGCGRSRRPSSTAVCPVASPTVARGPVDLPGDVRAGLQAAMSDSTLMAPHECTPTVPAGASPPPNTSASQIKLPTRPGGFSTPCSARPPEGSCPRDQLREVFDAEFGEGAGRRVG